MLVVGRFEIASLSSSDADGIVILDDSIVQVIREGGEELRDMPAIIFELRCVVRENIGCCLDRLVPCCYDCVIPW